MNENAPEANGLPFSLPSDFISEDGKSLGWRAYVILALLCFAFFLPGLTAIPPVDRDEPHFAQATKQMIETGNYVDIRFQKETRYKKPVGIYWLQAASVKMLSPANLDAIWAYRVPSVLGATVAVLMTAALGALLFGPLAGFMAALLIASCLILNVEARLAKTDAVLLACVVVAQYGLARAYMHGVTLPQGERGFTGWPVFFAFWLAQGAGFLIKGPLVLLLTASTLLYLKITEKRIGWVKSLRPAIGIPFALLLAAPWFAAIMLASQGGFAAQSAGHDLFAKLWQGQDRGIMPPGLHLLVFPLMFFPGSLLALLAIPGVWQNRKDSAVRFCLGWILFPWLLFELSLTKLPHYVLPLYPAVALLASAMMLKGFPLITTGRWRWINVTAFGAWLAAGMLVAAGVMFMPFFSDRVWQPAAIMAGVILLGTQAAFFVLLASRAPKSLLVLTGGSLLFTLLTFGIVIPSLRQAWLTRQVMQVAETVKPCAGVKIVSSTYNEPSLVFMAGTDTEVFSSGVTAARAMLKDSCLLGLISSNSDEAFRAAFKGSGASPVALSHSAGLNIGNGRRTELTLYRLEPAPNK
ncbi:MAG: glycosyltransferase family 39 protein [Alphaproteobacteria bacterium]|nr:glycosyltransferase family 39 protein [Alphaproteobacteria bacterium]